MASRPPRRTQPTRTAPATGAGSVVAPPGDPTVKGELLTTDVVVGGAPGSATTGKPPLPGVPYRIQAVGSREYVAGQQTVYMYNWLRSLPWAIDDISTDFGDDLYQRMLYDDAVRAAVTTMLSAILSERVDVIPPAVDEADEQGAKKAADIAAVCRRALGNMDNLEDVLWDMAQDALTAGNKVAELIFAEGRGQDKGKLVVTAIKPKRRRVISFVVDVYLNTVGFLALIPGQFWPVQIGIIISEPDNIPNLLPREKFAVLTWRPKDGDPRGTSILRAAYTAWNFKMQLWGEYMKFLANFVVPSFIGFLPENAQDLYASDSEGNLKLDVNGDPIPIDPTYDMASKLSQLRNAGSAAFPFSASVQVVQAAASANAAFDNAFGFLNDCIARAILGQTLATGEGKHDSRAAAQVHMDVLLLLIKQAKQSVCAMLRRDIFTPIVKYNYGEDALDYIPEASLGDVSEPDKAALWAAIASLKTADAVLPSQWKQLYAEVGLPEADAAELEKLTTNFMEALSPVEQAQQEHENALAVAQARGMQPGGPNATPPRGNGASGTTPAGTAGTRPGNGARTQRGNTPAAQS